MDLAAIGNRDPLIWTRSARLVALTIAAFAILLLYTLHNLLTIQEELHGELREANLWAATQAEREAQKLVIALERVPEGEAAAEAAKLQFEILYSRVSLLAENPQYSYFRGIGLGDLVQRSSSRIMDLDLALQESELSTAAISQITARASALGDILREIAVATNLEERRERSLRRQYLQRMTTLLIVAILGILITGAVLSVLMVQNLRELTVAQGELKEHQARLEKTIAERTAELRKALKVERRAKEVYRSFIATVSHQFRTPVSVIHLISQRQLKGMDPSLSEGMKRKFQKIFDASERLERLIGTFLDSANLEGTDLALTTRPVDFNEIIAAAVQQIREADPDRALEADYAPMRLMVDGDPVLLEQAILNLLSNAMKYSCAPAVVSVATIREHDRVSCTVRDEGVGVPFDAQASIFEKFFRAPGAHTLPGVGLGLALVRDIVELHGGKVTFCSREHHGSTFAICLPAAREGRHE